MARKEEDYGRKRERLRDKIPLDMPYALYLSPAHICNFKCFYCLHGRKDEDKRRLGIKPVLMSTGMAERIAGWAAQFPRKLKRIMFSGCGEPLVNPEFAEIVHIFSSRGLSEKYELNTNAALLTPDTADAVIEAGIDRIRISIQGLSSKKYEEVCGVSLDYQEFLNNLKYLYHHKRGCSIYIKIMDSCLEEWETEKDFFEMFEDACDSMYIEHLIQAQPNMEDVYAQNKIGHTKSIHGKQVEEKEICPLMFYQIQVDAEGNVYPCCVVGLPESFALGNVENISLTDLWGNDKQKKLWIDSLKKNLDEWEVCRECRAFSSITQPEDSVDDCTDLLIQKILAADKEKICL